LRKKKGKSKQKKEAAENLSSTEDIHEGGLVIRSGSSPRKQRIRPMDSGILTGPDQLPQ
jgi:hypothetical protein